MSDYFVHRSHRVKLYKDLKFTGTRLRRSLIDLSEFENIEKSYSMMKRRLGITEGKTDLTTFNPPKEQQPKKVEKITPQERIANYHKERYEKRINDKMVRFDSSRSKNKKEETPLRSPMIALESRICRAIRQDRPSSYLEELKESEKQLNYVKSNSRRKRFYTPCTPNQFTRTRIVSLDDGWPKPLQNAYPLLEEKLNQIQLNQPEEKQSALEELKKYIQTMESENMNVTRGPSKDKAATVEHAHYNNSSYVFNQADKSKKIFEKARKALSTSFRSSQIIAARLTDYLEKKQSLRTDYKDLAQIIKVDRPVTSQIRRKNYQIIGKNNEKPIEHYRVRAEEQRNKVLEKNKDFYKYLLNSIVTEVRFGQTLQRTKVLCDTLRKYLMVNYKLDESGLKYIVCQADLVAPEHDSHSLQVERMMEDFLWPNGR